MYWRNVLLSVIGELNRLNRPHIVNLITTNNTILLQIYKPGSEQHKQSNKFNSIITGKFGLLSMSSKM